MALEAIAETIGLTRQDLEQNIRLAVSTVQNQWTAQKAHLHKGSSMRVVSYDELPLHELLIADQIVVVLLSSSIRHSTGMFQVAITFEQAHDRYPTSFLRVPAETLAGRNELWAGQV
jgi:hypothetical protein